MHKSLSHATDLVFEKLGINDDPHGFGIYVV